MNIKTVSVIVPIFNAESSLIRCVKSIREQSYEHLEIILVNDGSTDESGRICESLALIDERIQVYEQENKGPAAARNTGLRHATGMFIQFVDADDVIATNMIDSFIRSEIAPDLFICGYKWDDEDVIPEIEGEFTKSEFMKHFGSLYKSMLLSSPCNKIYKREIIEEYNITFDESLRYGEDLYFNLDYLSKTKSLYMTKKVLYQYTRTKNSLTTSFIPNLLELQIAIDKRVRDFMSEEDALTEMNKKNVAISFANSVLHATSNILHPQSPYDYVAKKKLLKDILHDNYIEHYYNYFTDSKQAKLFQYFMRKKNVDLAYLFFSVKEWLRHRAYPIFSAVRSFNRIGEDV